VAELLQLKPRELVNRNGREERVVVPGRDRKLNSIGGRTGPQTIFNSSALEAERKGETLGTVGLAVQDDNRMEVLPRRRMLDKVNDDPEIRADVERNRRASKVAEEPWRLKGLGQLEA